MQNSKPILLVEDDNVDVMVVERLLNNLKIVNSLVHFTNGQEALEYLRNEDDEKPCVIFLDLNMPKMNGIEFLKVVKAEQKLRKIPIVMLTTSKEEQDVIESFKFGINGYVVKPLDYEKFKEALGVINLHLDFECLAK
ncbi:MAG: chemotaxis protein CheY [Coxiella sp. DG_40]|nr:MAG: chemotaxis protein CheY [Coxiella sp. DG_40]